MKPSHWPDCPLNFRQTLKMDSHKSLFYEKLNAYYLKNKDAKKPWNYEEIKEVAKDILLAKQTTGKKTRRQYHLLSLYDTMKLGNKQIIIKKRLKNNDNIIYVTPYEDLFEILYSTHIAVGHGCRDKMILALKFNYQISRPVVEIFLQCCEVCHKKKVNKHANLVTKPIVSKEFCSRGQIDLIDYQSCQDNDYKWLLNYQDHLTKFICLRPLKSKQAAEVASELVKIFLEFGAPAILQSDNGREFVTSIIKELAKLWPDLKIVHGRPQSQESVERCNQDVENMLQAWMLDKNSTNWSVGCYFVQFQKNISHHRIIGRSPYRALFGINPKIGLSSTNLPTEVIKNLETEEDVNKLLADLKIKENNNIAENEQQETFGDETVTDIVGEQEGASSAIMEVIEADNFDPINVALPFAGPQEGICIDCKNQKNNASCVLCSPQTSIRSNRNECHSGQKRAAKKMLSSTAKKQPPLKIGDCVLLPVEKIDRGLHYS
ncbi:KRAB-A domain-containing protein 2-like [Tribolium madens]|uniref:KRAB-A domain-containing protein 2-like n=1 Tax=Tribolium madens TaxID=41895 RepID=UPI001CF75101|nr:KRAB-A domain-containing protein 2-like [Tribolium madens]